MKGETPGPVAMALVHYPVRNRFGGTQATSVTPLNVHDLARSAATFGVAPVYVVTPIISQQELVGRILKHWLEGYGGEQNPSRRESLGLVTLLSSINEAVDDIFRRTGSYPRIVGTGARRTVGKHRLRRSRREDSRVDKSLAHSLRDRVGAERRRPGTVRPPPRSD